MNISALKTFAPLVRRQLMEAVALKLDLVLSGRTPDYLDTFVSQVAALRKLEKEDRTGLIERVAYTWFNRFTALRFLDARGWHPFGVRVLTAATPDETQPELLKCMRAGLCPEELRRHTSLDRLNRLLDSKIPSADPQGEVYRHLVLAACRFYHELMPNLFERLDDETELLLPDDLLTDQSVVHEFRAQIADEECSEVEVIGWLYQFYISEKKDEVMARKSVVPSEDIPAVTQLFTPHWIVRYLVENSLGRLWMLNRPHSKLWETMPYYIKGEPEKEFLKVSSPEEIRIIDPAVGSGHMLTCAFEILYSIYEEEGYPPADIPGLILKNNLYGLDICPRASQLAELALVFKARERSQQFFSAYKLVAIHIHCMSNVLIDKDELRLYIDALGLGEVLVGPLLELLHQFSEASTYGSLIRPSIEEEQISFARRAVESHDTAANLFLKQTHSKVLCALHQAELLARKYHLVVANPPYMNSKGMSPKLKSFLESNYPQGKADLFAAFIQRSLALAQSRGQLGFVTPYVWMFILTFRPLRQLILENATVTNLVQLEYNAFEPACIPVCCFTLSKENNLTYAGNYIRLSDFRGSNNQASRTLEAIQNRQCGWFYRALAQDFVNIPSSPFVYWIKKGLLSAFGLPKLGEFVEGEGKNVTADNARFLRLVWEVDASKVGRGRKWLFYSKGGPYRKWAGNIEYVVDWSDTARTFYKTNNASRLIGEEFWYRPGITWTDITSTGTGFRYLPEDTTFDTTGLAVFVSNSEQLKPTLGLLNSRITTELLPMLNPTLHANLVDIKSIPVAEFPLEINNIVDRCIEIATEDWNTSETSHFFASLPLVRSSLESGHLSVGWQKWAASCTASICRMRELETENNRLFIDAYGLQDELTPEVREDQITLARANARKDMAAFLSYAVGCIMGRYSLDRPGLILANASESVTDYLAKVGRTRDQLTFVPDDDGIVAILDGEWFEDDIVARTREFLRATFGAGALKENLLFIEESLGRELRNYFLTDFYKDHLQTYKKRPIYWMVQSPKKGFSALIYLHRYNRDTMNLVLNRYLREYQVKLRSRISHLTDVQTSSAVSARDKTSARKEFNKLTKTLNECEEWERQVILPLAQARIELDLDDGVKVNYLKLEEALAPIPGLAAAED